MEKAEKVAEMGCSDDDGHKKSPSAVVHTRKTTTKKRLGAETEMARIALHEHAEETNLGVVTVVVVRVVEAMWNERKHLS